MEIYGWRKLFESGVLLDARNHVGMDDVICLMKGNIIHGKVRDDREYVVDIQVDDGTIQSMMCSCGYDGCCSHMAAVLYEAERMVSEADIESGEPELPDCMGWWSDRSECSEEDEDRLLSTIEGMTESQLKTALYHFGRRSSFLRENLMTRFSRRMDPKIAENVKYMIDEVENDFKNECYPRDCIVDEDGYVERIEEILDRFIPGFIHEKLFKEASDIAIYALETVGWHFLSDEDVKGEFGNVIAGYWNTILSRGDESSRKHLLAGISEVEHYDGNDSFVV